MSDNDGYNVVASAIRRQMMVRDPIMEQQKTEAHEWECKKCRYTLRLEIGPLCREGGICNKCGSIVIYNGIKRDILKSTLGISSNKP